MPATFFLFGTQPVGCYTEAGMVIQILFGTYPIGCHREVDDMAGFAVPSLQQTAYHAVTEMWLNTHG